MKIDAQSVKNFRCPRWDELPGIPLYMDQVILVLEEHLRLLAFDEKIITPTMVNNYVKQKVIPPPEKKKYERAHIAELFVISTLKRVCSIKEISVVKEALIEAQQGIKPAYETFCIKLEEALHATFVDKGSFAAMAPLQTGPVAALESAMASLMGKLYVQQFVKECAENESLADDSVEETPKVKANDKTRQKKQKDAM